MPKSSHDHAGGHARGLWYMCDMHLAGQLAEGVLDGRPISHSGRCTLASCHNSIGAAGTQRWNRGCAGSGNVRSTLPEKKSTQQLVLTLAPVCLAACIHGLLKDGIMTWVPSFLQEKFSLLTAFSVSLTMLLPLVNLSGVYIGNAVNVRRFRNEASTACLFLWGMRGRLAPVAVLGQRKSWDYIRSVAVQHHLLDECKHDATQSVAVAL